MKRFGLISLAVLASAGLARAQGDEDFIDQLAPFLTASTFRDQVRARVSGLVDLEGYYVQRPPPGLIETRHDLLFNPRLTLFLDGQIGSSIYGFAQARLDRGFDPQEGGANVRLDEYALRFGFDHGRFNVQVGQFGTIVGNWVLRHDSWENPFVTAPFPYENLTGIWDIAAPGATETLFAWAHVNGHDNGDYSDKHLRLPIVWGPSYASGAAVFGWLGQFGYAAEIKNASLSSRPETWSVTETGLQHPTVSLRLGFRPNVKWHFGFSASEGPYLQPAAAPSLPAGRSVGDYRELVLGQDISFAWRHLQIWAECYEARFQVAQIGNADTLSGYVEIKYKFTPRLFGALRWNQQLYATVPDAQGNHEPWGNDAQRLDFALGYRFTPHLQLKLQYSAGHEELATGDYHHTVAGQMTLKF